MNLEDKFKQIAMHDRSTADHILSRSEQIDQKQLETLINLYYNEIVNNLVQETKWNTNEIVYNFLKVCQNHKVIELN